MAPRKFPASFQELEIPAEAIKRLPSRARKENPGYWVWKYSIDGFAVQDLWYQGADSLPSYMGSLGRSYQLTAMRIYESASKEWKVAWMANGAGSTPGQDFGTFQAALDGDKIVVTSPPGRPSP